MNLRMAQEYPVLNGIFITRVHGLGDQPLPAVTCIGTRPTVDDSGRRAAGNSHFRLRPELLRQAEFRIRISGKALLSSLYF